jgi:hypothetical protein
VTFARRAGRLVAAVAVLASHPVLADDASPPIVRVFVAGSPEAVAASRDAVQDLCAHANVAVIVRDAAGADEELLSNSHPRGLAEAYIDLRAGMPARVVVVDSETRENLERRTLPEASSLEMSIETSAHVVCAAVESAISARKAREAARAAAPPEPPPKAEPKDSGGGIESRVSGFGIASDFGFGLVGGGGAAFGLRFGASTVRFGAMLPLFGYARGEVEQFGGETSFIVLSGRLLPTIDWQATRPVGFFAGIGGGVDWVHVEPELPPPGTLQGGKSELVEGIGSVLIGATANISENAGAFLTFGLDVAFTPHRYVIETPDGVSTFFEPSRVRPTAMLGAFFSFGGPDRPGGEETTEKRQ